MSNYIGLGLRVGFGTSYTHLFNKCHHRHVTQRGYESSCAAITKPLDLPKVCNFDNCVKNLVEMRQLPHTCNLTPVASQLW